MPKLVTGCRIPGDEGVGYAIPPRGGTLLGHEIRITGGKLVSINGANAVHADNDKSFALDTELLFWRVEHAASAAL
jgi:hypothetical protein